ncbi:hypothetical protein [Nocardioides sp. KR10-350]|uniref:hypothetical protein n=1 Tax=Nocardioides cheoyonin TaxID=3156615 RepID=UPI0032B53963
MEGPNRFPNEGDWQRHVPAAERLPELEIDLTGVNRDPSPLFDAISDALIEAQANGGEIPEWGARVLARYLANNLDASGSALHHFAVTGRADLSRLAHELVGFAVRNDSRVAVAACTGLLAEYLKHQEQPDDDEADGLVVWRELTLRCLATPIDPQAEADDGTA